MEHEGAGVTQVMQTSNMNVLMEKTRNMTLSQLEALYSGRFHEGEIREMKQEFDNIAKASAERAGAEIAPPPDCSARLSTKLTFDMVTPSPPETYNAPPYEYIDELPSMLSMSVRLSSDSVR